MPLIARIDRHAARLARHKCGERQQLAAFKPERRRILALTAADVDLLREVDRAAAFCIKSRIARRNPLHAGTRIAVAVCARFCVCALRVPQRFALDHPQRRRICHVVVLHRPGFAAHGVVAGASFGQGDVIAEGARDDAEHDKDAAETDNANVDAVRSHSTVIWKLPGCGKPVVAGPGERERADSVATVWNVMNGLAAIAGYKDRRGRSLRRYRCRRNEVMMSRGIGWPIWT